MIQFSKALIGKWELTYGQIPVTGFNIVSGNNVIDFMDATGTYASTIPPGYYTPTTLAAAVATVMSASSTQVYTTAVSATTGILTITNGTGVFTVLFSTRKPTTYANNPGATIAAILGFPQQDINSGAGNNLVASNPINLLWNRNINFEINELFTKPLLDGNSLSSSATTAQAGAGGKSFAFHVGIASTPINTVHEYIPNDQYQCVDFGPNGTNFLTIQTYGDNGALYNFNGFDWDIILNKVGYHYK
jgi:hypothetical protein